jgi:hypothetical protein
MGFNWFNTKVAVDAGGSLADQFLAAVAKSNAKRNPNNKAADHAKAIEAFLVQVDREVRPLRLGVFRRAKLANTFKWRLLDQGVDRVLADELTRMLLLRLT